MTDILPPAGWPNVRQLETIEFATGGALAKLKALCLYPHNENTASYNGDQLYKDLTAERVLTRGGAWGDAAGAGVFELGLYRVRTNTYPYLGARPAFVSL